jgi:phosphoesterase RecJ-like protein
MRILIITHIYPDGDCIGSSLALAIGLRSIGKYVDIVDEHVIPPAYAFLPHSNEILQPSGVDGEYDLVIAVDASDVERLGAASSLLGRGNAVVSIDHHATSEEFAEVNWIEPEAAATGELIYILLNELGISISKDIAVCLYTALSTDTGSFRFSNTTKRTFEIASHLVGLGANPGDISENVFDTKPYAALKLLGTMLEGLSLSDCGQVAWMALTKEMMSYFDVTAQDIEGFVNYARMVEGVLIALLFREEDDAIKISLRGRGDVDVSVLALELGGGGHAKAAGCSVKGSLDEVKQRVVELAVAYLAGRDV